MGWICIILLTLLARTKSENETCKMIGQSGFMEFFKEGDFFIGGVFSIESSMTLVDNDYQALPYTYCKRWNPRELKFARTMMFTVEEINRDNELLPGVSLGYRVFNGCGTENLLRAAIEAVNGNDPRGCHSQTLAVLGHSSSGVSDDINKILSAMSIPQLSHLSTCACLSDKKRYPTFFRTVPSDHFQIIALIQLMKYFNWRWMQRTAHLCLCVLFLNTVTCCELFGKFNMPSLFKEGDIMIGGIFPVLNKEIGSIVTFEREPPGVKCAVFDLRAFRWAQVMIFAIEEINNNPHLLPNLSLGYRILNSCSSPTNTLRAALTLASRPVEKEMSSSCLPTMSAVIAEAGSSQSMAVAGTLGPFQGDFSPLMKEVVKHNITGIQWLASEAWITAPQPSTPEMYQAFGGALGFVVQNMAIPKLKPFLTAISPYTDPNAAFVKDFWEIMVGCRLNASDMNKGEDEINKVCTGNENLMNSQEVFFNVTQLRVAYNVYKAVYAIAHALHQLVFCQPAGEKTDRPCLDVSKIKPKEVKQIANTLTIFPTTCKYIFRHVSMCSFAQVAYHLQRVNFKNEFGDSVFFDENGDPPASYDIINWQLKNGQVQHVKLGHFASDENGNYKLSIQEEKIVWRTGKKHVSADFVFHAQLSLCPPFNAHLKCKIHLSIYSFNECPSFVADGQFVIGGIFPLHYNQEMPDLNCTYRPPPVKCNGFDPRAFRWALTMRLAVEEINQSPELLPNYTLGYKIFDSCAYPLTGQRAALAVLNGLSENDSPVCSGASPLLAVIGESGSAQSIVVSRILRPFRIPMISYFSSCACFTDRRKYPTFFRVIPNDDYQVKAIAQLLVRFNWTWVGLVRGDHEYGRFAVQGLLRELQGTNVCVAYQEMIPLLYNRQKALEIMQVMRTSMAKVVVVFSAEGEMTPFLRDYMIENITGIQWVASEAWITASVFTGNEYYPFLGGTIGFGIRKGHISRLSDYLLTVSPQNYPNNRLVDELWEALYGCSPFPSSASQLPLCTGQEMLLEQHSAYMNTSSPRVAYNVYKAVYAVAHSLHNLLLCQEGSGPFQNKSCAQPTNVLPWQQYLQEVTFNMAGEEVNFDLKGDSVPYYDIINWQRGTSGSIEFVTVGLFDGTKPTGDELLIQEDRIMCQCLYAAPAVLRGPGKLSVVGSLFAALTVYHVTVAKLAIRQ
ncbi:unnamed protein product, partial [Menidia menidia]